MKSDRNATLISAFGGYTDSDQWPGVGFGGTQISLRW